MQLLVVDKVEVIFTQYSAMRIFIQLTALGGTNIYMKWCSCPNNNIHFNVKSSKNNLSSQARIIFGNLPIDQEDNSFTFRYWEIVCFLQKFAKEKYYNSQE
jgi:hypothetical protein